MNEIEKGVYRVSNKNVLECKSGAKFIAVI